MTIAAERRAETRGAPQPLSRLRSALLRPGQDVLILNLSAGGALVESAHRLKPGARTELQLLGPTRAVVRGRIDRCRVIAIEPMRYEAAIVFDEPLTVPGSG